MSTVTKIKGIIENDSLPVLTSKGLLSQYVGKYVAKMDALGYTITDEQMEAFNTFMKTLVNGDVLQYVKTFYPFIGDTTHYTAANVPLIGSTELTFTSSDNAYDLDSDDNIIGITKFVAMPNVSMADVMGDNLHGVGLSYNGTIETTLGTPARILTFKDGNDEYVFRVMLTSANGERFGVYHYVNSTDVGSQEYNYDLGTGYNTLIGVHGYGANGRFIRTVFKDGTLASAAGGSGAEKDFYDAAATIVATTKPGGVDCITSLMFMKDIMPSEISKRWCSALHTLLVDLGKISE